LHEATPQACGIASRGDDQLIDCQNEAWSSEPPGLAKRWLPCCADHLHVWLELVGALGALTARTTYVANPARVTQTMLLPHHIQRVQGYCDDHWYRLFYAGAFHPHTLRPEEALVLSDALLASPAQGSAQLAAALEVLAARLDPNKTVKVSVEAGLNVLVWLEVRHAKRNDIWEPAREDEREVWEELIDMEPEIWMNSTRLELGVTYDHVYLHELKHDTQKQTY
jgi:hypothetical protein